MVKNVLCFGDSNTFAFIPGDGKRYPKGVRWTSVLGELLGDEYKIFEAGCNNRACFVEHVDGEKFIGKKFIKKYSQYDFDIIISALGSNDVQKRYHPTCEELEQGFEEYIEVLKSTFNSKIVILAPSLIDLSVVDTWFEELFDEGSVETSKYLPEIWEIVSKKTDCYFLNLNDKVKPSVLDGLHFDEEGHRVIAQELAKFIKSI